ncbi:MAG TPA: TerC family protein [Phycisphaerales bacterium]|nr:TerC family protein [Phycisphaerales bacterium]
MDFSLLFTAENALALLTLSALEIVLGIDNIVFIAILSGKLPPDQRNKARKLGLLGAMVTRILLLLCISWVMGLTKPLFTISYFGGAGALSGKDLILLVGGLFLIAKAVHEIHNKLEGEEDSAGDGRSYASMGSVIAQIMVMDIIFSLDSVITAVGMVRAEGDRPLSIALTIMIAAVMIAIMVMMIFARPISDFVERHPTVKVLALSFLVLIGVMLVADAFDHHIPKGYIYFAMAFSLLVELLNMRLRKVATPLHLRDSHMPE